VAMIFARSIDDAQTAKLIKKIDEANAKNKDLVSFVVFLNDSEKADVKIKEMAEKEKITKTILSVDNPAGPEKYNVAKDAEVTVVLYVERNVKANHSFKKGELKDDKIETIVKDLSKIVK
jgi:predicted DNA-binding ribbon-helix-helix protein